MKWLALTLLFLTAIMQLRLWSSDGGVRQLEQLEKSVAEHQRVNQLLKQRNQELMKQVQALKESDDAIEHYARARESMIKQGETFYRFVSKKD